MNIESEILTALRRIVRAIDLHSRELARRHGLTGPQLLVLNQLESLEDGLTVGSLADAIELSQPTVTGIVNRLERRGLVTRDRSLTDRRCVLVRVTPIGRRVLEDAPPLLHEHLRLQLQALDGWEQTQILSTLQRLVAMMQAEDIEAAPLLVNGSIDDEPLRQVAAPVELPDKGVSEAT